MLTDRYALSDSSQIEVETPKQMGHYKWIVGVCHACQDWKVRRSEIIVTSLQSKLLLVSVRNILSEGMTLLILYLVRIL